MPLVPMVFLLRDQLHAFLLKIIPDLMLNELILTSLPCGIKLCSQKSKFMLNLVLFFVFSC